MWVFFKCDSPGLASGLSPSPCPANRHSRRLPPIHLREFIHARDSARQPVPLRQAALRHRRSRKRGPRPRPVLPATAAPQALLCDCPVALTPGPCQPRRPLITIGSTPLKEIREVSLIEALELQPLPPRPGVFPSPSPITKCTKMHQNAPLPCAIAIKEVLPKKSPAPQSPISRPSRWDQA